MKKLYLIFLMISVSGPVLSTPGEKTLPGDQVVPGDTTSPYVPGDQVIPHLDLSDVSIDDMIAKSQQMIKKALSEEVPESAKVSTNNQKNSRTGVNTTNPVPKKKIVQPQSQTTDTYEPRGYYSGMNVIHKNLKYLGMDSFHKMVLLPNGSVALGTAKNGVEVSSTFKKVLVELDYTFLGPNGAIVEMKGCRLWVKVVGNQVTSRVEGDPAGEKTEITCMTPSGKSFTKNIKVHLLDGHDEYSGVKGERVFYGKDIALILDFLNGGLKAYGDALSRFQVKTDVSEGETPIKTENVTGDEKKYIAGQTLSGSMGKMMNWWVDYYMGLAPQVAVPTGSKVFVGVDGSIEVPEEFFGTKITTDYLKDYLRHANTKGQIK